MDCARARGVAQPTRERSRAREMCSVAAEADRRVPDPLVRRPLLAVDHRARAVQRRVVARAVRLERVEHDDAPLARRDLRIERGRPTSRERVVTSGSCGCLSEGDHPYARKDRCDFARLSSCGCLSTTDHPYARKDRCDFE